MHEIKSIADIEAIGTASPHQGFVRQAFEGMTAAYRELGDEMDPDTDGYMVLLEAKNAWQELLEITNTETLDDVLLEWVEYHEAEGCFVCAWIPGNNFGLQLFVPDGPDLDKGLRQWLLGQAKPGEVPA